MKYINRGTILSDYFANAVKKAWGDIWKKFDVSNLVTKKNCWKCVVKAKCIWKFWSLYDLTTQFIYECHCGWQKSVSLGERLKK